ncbi:uncharacterized protein TRIVIDRAFT_70050 [Trichoderma virens Gv29-8]|uniref:Uncharacterized protein n=1 Tax=Hypocrea virens (strain Gv29-8 / FGSC 10586) TaxID=413071 RepID=G9NDN0_HYPVG|nr:uncharacterized protein TRIVIDRAFT_70050 [Trichoderma virens Gv29-8]EHK15131.1 hypothetical protein TRIVIDRAFT_70050 [Trichoderma virens Gv29-8]UKZ57970.1 hypothetical protein TrVGV298_011831 [Trichoderma virens]
MSCSSPLDRFDKFPLLPPELRSNIWRLNNLNPSLDNVIEFTFVRKEYGDLERAAARRLLTFISREAHESHQKPGQIPTILRPKPDLKYPSFELPAIPLDPSDDVIYTKSLSDAWHFVSYYPVSGIKRFALRDDFKKSWMFHRASAIRAFVLTAEEIIIVDTLDTSQANMDDFIKDLKATCQNGLPSKKILGEINLRVWKGTTNEKGEICSLVDTGRLEK